MTNPDTNTLNAALEQLGITMATNITAKGVSASASDGLTTLAGKISQISQSGGGTPVVEFDNTNFGTHFAFTRPIGNYKNTFTIHVPSGTTHLMGYCFYYLKNLTGIDLPTGLTEIGQYAFYYCEGLTEVEIPNTVSAIGENAFYYCTSLQSVNIPTSLSSIPTNCFRYSGLTSVTIPSNITSMSNYAFRDCSNLETIHFDSATPPSLGTGVFQNLPTSCVIEVPCDSLSLYTSASNYPSSSTYTYVPYGCNGLKFLQDSYSTSTGTCEVSLRLWDNNAPVSGGTITITGSDSSSYTCTTDSNGEATCTLTNVSGTVTYTATYSSYSATCTVTAQTVTVYYESALTSDDGKWQKSSSSGMNITYDATNGCTVTGTTTSDRTYYINTSSVTIPTSDIVVEFDMTGATLGAYNNSTELVAHNAKILLENANIECRPMNNNEDRTVVVTNPSYPLHFKFEITSSQIKVYYADTLVKTITANSGYRRIGFKTYNQRGASMKNLKVYELL